MLDTGGVGRSIHGSRAVRLGQRLIQGGLITIEQLAHGLRAQSKRGGRLGSNLVELGHLEIDVLAQYLGRQHGMPTALGRHFELRDPHLATRLSAEMAGRWGVIPLAAVAGNIDQVAVAVMDPLPQAAADEIASLLGHPLIQAVTAETRIRHYMERLYGLPRATLARRSVRVGAPMLIAAEDPEYDLCLHLEDTPPADDTALANHEIYDELEETIELDLDSDISDAADSGMPMSALVPQESPEGSSTPTKPAVDQDAIPQLVSENDSSQTTKPVAVQHLGHISLPSKSPSQSPNKSPSKSSTTGVATAKPALVALSQPPLAGDSLDPVLDAIKQATGRDRIGDLVVGGLRESFVLFQAGAILVVRDALVVGWKGFVSHRPSEAIQAIALPLDTPSAIADAFRQRRSFIDAPSGREGDRRIWATLGVPPPQTIAVVPVPMEHRVACVLYGHTNVAPDAARAAIGDRLTALAHAAGTAFARIFRAARR